MKVETINTIQLANRLSATSRAIGRALERLESGQRIVHPRDDIAGYSTSLRLSSQVRGLSEIARSINQAQSLLTVAESSVGSQIELVHRMRELALQASSSILTSSDRANLQKELSSLLEEYSRIASTTEFNGREILNGSFGTLSLLLSDHSNADPLTYVLPNTSMGEVFDKTYGTGTFFAATSFTVSGMSDPEHIQTGDFNNDGKADLVVGDGSVFSIQLGNGDGSFAQMQTFSGVSGPIIVADLNNDGVDDILSTSTSAFVYYGKGDGTFQSAQCLGSGSRVGVADFNHDGINDYIVSSNTTASVYLGNSSGNFSLISTFNPDQTPSPFSFGDLNGDGNLDLAFGVGTLGSGAVKVALGDGAGNFSTPTNVNSAYISPTDIQLADFNNDGALDIVAAHAGSSVVRVAFNNGQGAFSAFTDLASGAATTNVRAFDFNRDGNMDILSVDSSAGSASLFLGNGNGTFQTKKTLSGVGSGIIQDLVAADFNGDGVLDFATADPFYGAVSTAIMKTEVNSAIADVTLVSSQKARDALEILDNALAHLTDYQVSLSSLHERLDIAASSNLLIGESLEEAKDRILSVDLALETAELVRLQVLQQAEVAVLAQANLQLQTVLALLRYSG